VGAATKAGLVVVGRGPKGGRRRGGNFAERVVYSARCSVLVVQHAPAVPA
jgi:nucleotide-binding universal stress UspA family protein